MDYSKQSAVFLVPIIYWLAFVSFALTIIVGAITLHAGEAAKRQKNVEAVIVSLGPWAHGRTYNYSFNVGREVVRGNVDEQIYGKHNIGDTVNVYYDPLNPVNNNMNPLAGGWRDAACVGLLGGGAAIFLFMLGKIIVRSRTRLLGQKSDG